VLSREEQKNLEASIAAGSKEVKLYFELGASYLDSGEFEGLQNLYKRLIQLPLSSREHARAQYEIGQALQLANRTGEAMPCYLEALKALSQENTEPDDLLLIGLSHYGLMLSLDDVRDRAHHKSMALKCFLEILRGHPSFGDNDRVHSHVADIYFREGEYDKAIESYQSALMVCKNEETVIWLLSGMAAAYAQKRSLGQAISFFKEALEKARAREICTSKIHYDIGMLYFEDGDLQAAKAAFTKALIERGRDPILKHNRDYEIDLLWHLGTIAYESGEEKAADYMYRVLGLGDREHYYYVNCRLTLGHCFLKRGAIREAREEYCAALEAANASNEEVEIARECLSGLPSA